MIQDRSLERALRELHRVLLAQAVREYVKEKELAQPPGPGELLMLTTRDDAFAWLRSLSELMADIDHFSEPAPDPADEGARSAVRGAVEQLLAAPGETSTGAFASRYWHYIHEVPDVAVAHAAVKQALQHWPAPSDDEKAHRAVLADHLARRRTKR